ncbi:MAG TPA: CHAD domain-containing protein [Thiobacillaceae bacterium]|nr:CHAD domain-containing protein [Thiobacillaceae bacterium]
MTDPGREIELKLLLPAGSAALLRHPRLNGTRPTRQRLHTVYFDTQDFALAKRGVALRVRRAGRRWIQTLKTEANSSGGLSTRIELEVPASGPGIEFDRFPAEAGDHVPESLREKLAPAFETRFLRRSWQVTGIWGSQIEVALDEGEIRAGDKTEAIRELELELKSGRPDALFALALELARSVPLWPFDRSKAERGAGLAKGIAAGPVKAKLPLLERRLKPADAWRMIGAQLLRQFAGNLPGIAYDQNVEYLHQARVALRRFRSAYALFKRGFPLPLTVLGELKELNASLGPARDWDVFCTQTLPPILGAVPDVDPLQRLADLADKARRQAHERLAQYLRSPACGGLLLGLARRLSASPKHFVAELGDARVESFAARHLKKRHRQTMALAAAVEMDAVGRHRLRISIKHLRYVLDCFAGLYPRRAVGGMSKALGNLQDVLGHMNDQAVAHRLIQTIDDGSADFAQAQAVVRGWLAAIVVQSELSLAGDLKELSAIKRFW